MNIKEIALRLAKSMRDKSGYTTLDLVCNAEAFAEALAAELAKENKPVAWMYEYSYDLNGDKQGHWPVEMYTHVSFSRSKPSVESTPLYPLPPTAEQIEQETVEACAKVCKALADCDENTEPYRQGASWCEEAIRSGAWKEYK